MKRGEFMYYVFVWVLAFFLSLFVPATLQVSPEAMLEIPSVVAIVTMGCFILREIRKNNRNNNQDNTSK